MYVKNSSISRVLPTPGSPARVTSCAEPSAAQRRYCSIVRNSWGVPVRPTNDVVRCARAGRRDPRCAPRAAARSRADPPCLSRHRRELFVVEDAGGGTVRRLSDDDGPGGATIAAEKRCSRRRPSRSPRSADPTERDDGLAGLDPMRTESPRPGWSIVGSSTPPGSAGRRGSRARDRPHGHRAPNTPSAASPMNLSRVPPKCSISRFSGRDTGGASPSRPRDPRDPSVP